MHPTCCPTGTKVLGYAQSRRRKALHLVGFVALPFLISSRISELGMDGSPVERGNDTLEEREARVMASTTALRRDFAPIIRVRVVQEMGAIRLQVLEAL